MSELNPNSEDKLHSLRQNFEDVIFPVLPYLSYPRRSQFWSTGQDYGVRYEQSSVEPAYDTDVMNSQFVPQRRYTAGAISLVRTVGKFPGLVETDDPSSEFKDAETTYQELKATVSLLQRAPRLEKACQTIGIFARREVLENGERLVAYHVPLPVILEQFDKPVTKSKIQVYPSRLSVGKPSRAMRFVEALGTEHIDSTLFQSLSEGEVPIHPTTKGIMTIPMWLALPPEVFQGLCIAAGNTAKPAIDPADRTRKTAQREAFMEVFTKHLTASAILDIDYEGHQSESALWLRRLALPRNRDIKIGDIVNAVQSLFLAVEPNQEREIGVSADVDPQPENADN